MCGEFIKSPETLGFLYGLGSAWLVAILTTVQLIWVICAVFCPITPPSYIDALSTCALKLRTATVSCRKQRKEDVFESSSLRFLWSACRFTQQSSITHFMCSKTHLLIVALLHDRCPSCWYKKEVFFFYYFFDKWVTKFMTAVAILHATVKT